VIKIKIFVDSGKLDEIKKAKEYGILDGVTTNPSLIKASVEEEKNLNIDIKSYINKILTVAKGVPVSLEVIGNTYEDMLEQGKLLYKMFNPVAGNVYVKIPVNPCFKKDSNNNFDGIKAIRVLSDISIPVNCTLIFTPEQALLAAKAGAKFVSPFVGRIDDYIRLRNNIEAPKYSYYPSKGLEKEGIVLEDNGIVSGVELVAQIRKVFDNYKIKDTKLLAASIRNPRQVREVALAGADIATIPLLVIDKLLIHYKTQEGMRRFTEDVVPEYEKLFDI
jgi:transaldolase